MTTFREGKEPRSLSSMESEHPAASEALDAVARTRELNAERLRRPRRYWTMLGGFMTVFALQPYTFGWPAVWQFVIPPLVVIAIAIIAAWKQPTAVRRIRLSGRMSLQLAGFVVPVVVIVSIGRALYTAERIWWAPLAAAVLVFAAVVVLGRAMDRSWERQVSGVGR